jgi:hypothetical protein
MEYKYIWIIRDRAERVGCTWIWLGNRAGLWLHLFHLCQLRTVRCIGFHSQVTDLLVPSIYLLMGVGRLVSLLSWVPARFELAFWVVLYIGLRRSKHHTEAGPAVLGAWSPSLDGDLDPLTGEERVGLAYARGTNKACVFGAPNWAHWFVNHRQLDGTAWL